MNVSFPPVLGSTVKPAPRTPAEPINSFSPEELQNLYTDQFETSSKFPAVELSDIEEDSLDLLELMDIQSETPESSALIVELNKEDFWDLMDTQSEALNPGEVDAFLQTRQPASQAATTPNPFHAVLAPQAPLPIPPKQQKITNSKGQQALNKRKSPSRHELYKEILSTEQTDDEYESADKQVRTEAMKRLSRRKSRQVNAHRLGLTVAQHKRQQREALAARKGITFTALGRQDRQAMADKRDLTPAQLDRQYAQDRALKKSTESPI